MQCVPTKNALNHSSSQADWHLLNDVFVFYGHDEKVFGTKEKGIPFRMTFS